MEKEFQDYVQEPLADRLNKSLNLKKKHNTNAEAGDGLDEGSDAELEVTQDTDSYVKDNQTNINHRRTDTSEKSFSNIQMEGAISDAINTDCVKTLEENDTETEASATSKKLFDLPEDGSAESDTKNKNNASESNRGFEVLAENDECDKDNAFHTDEGSGSDSEAEYESAEEGEEIQVDKQNLQDLEESLTEEQKEERRNEAQKLKEQGNEYFRTGSYKTAIRTYSRALRTCPLKYAKDRAIMYSNRAACKMRLEDYEDSIKDSTKALELHPHYMKALMRRAELYEKTEKLDEALADYQKIVEFDPSQHTARAACMRLPDQIKERNEKMKEEMMSKLKDLGNMILRPFGLSTNNFQVNQDPNSGGYSVNFVQNPSQT